MSVACESMNLGTGAASGVALLAFIVGQHPPADLSFQSVFDSGFVLGLR